VSPRGSLDADVVAAYGRLGVDRLVLIPPDAFRQSADAPEVSLADLEAFVRDHAAERLAATPLGG
jgi:hypothetical protein